MTTKASSLTFCIIAPRTMSTDNTISRDRTATSVESSAQVKMQQFCVNKKKASATIHSPVGREYYQV